MEKFDESGWLINHFTEADLQEMRKKSVQEIGDPNIKFTCDQCPWSEAHRCPFVYNGYNTGGDCLMEK